MHRRTSLGEGAHACLSPALAVLVLAFAMGSIAEAKGWTLPYVIVFCIAIVGASVQAATLQLWPPGDPVGVVLACVAIHSRYILVCASVEPLWRGLSLPCKLFLAHFTTDSNWAVTIARMRDGQSATPAFLLGGGLAGC